MFLQAQLCFGTKELRVADVGEALLKILVGFRMCLYCEISV